MPDPNNIIDIPTKTAWLCVPKAANGAVKRALLEWNRIVPPNDQYGLHNHPSFRFASTEAIAYQFSHYERIAFCRNPWDRLVSCWNDTCHREGFWESIPMWKMRTGMSFEEFLFVACNQKDHEQNIHYRSLSALMCWNEKPAFDLLVKFERLDDGWRKVQKKYPTLPSLTRTNVTQHKPWQEYYTKKMFADVAYRYAADIIRFGYSDELSKLSELAEVA